MSKQSNGSSLVQLGSNLVHFEKILLEIKHAYPINNRSNRLITWNNGWANGSSYFGDTCIVSGEFVESPGLERKLLDGFLLDLCDKYCKNETELSEFGCGSGSNLALLVGKIRRLRGFDWSQAAVDRVRGRQIEAERFDMFAPHDVGLRGAVLTVHAMEQLGESWRAMLDYLLACRPSVVVHIEPMLELYDELNLLDYLHAQYHRKRQYLYGYLPELQRLAQDGVIELLEVRRSGFSGLLHDAYSVVVWRCAAQ